MAVACLLRLETVRPGGLAAPRATTAPAVRMVRDGNTRGYVISPA